jgi:hypothetical protein
MLGAIVGDVIGSPYLLDPVMNIYMSPDLAQTARDFCDRFAIPV